MSTVNLHFYWNSHCHFRIILTIFKRTWTRPSAARGWPSRYQLTRAVGEPPGTHWNCAALPTSTTWDCGWRWAESGAVTVSGSQERVVALCWPAARELLVVRYEQTGGTIYNSDCKENGDNHKHLGKTIGETSRNIENTRVCWNFSKKKKETKK